MKYTILFLLLLFAALFLRCENPVQGTVSLDEEFKIKVGQQVVIKGEDLKINFSSVTEDSRCPLNLRCFWSGNAEAVLEIQKSKEYKIQKGLNTHLDPRETEYLNYKIILKNLDPYPRQDEIIPQFRYIATLIVKENN